MKMKENKKIIIFIGSVGVITGVYLIFKYIFPVLAPFIIAFLLAYAIEKPVVWLAKYMRDNKILASSIIITLIAGTFFVGIGYIAYRIFLELKSFVIKYDMYISIANDKLCTLCDSMDNSFNIKRGSTLQFINDNIGYVTEKFKEKVIPAIMDGSLPLLMKVIAAITIFFIILMSAIYVSKELDSVRAWRENSVFTREIKMITQSIGRLGRVYYKVQLVIMACTAVICVVGLFIIKNPYAVVLGIFIGLVDALPLFGTGTILIPWTIIELLSGHFVKAAIIFTIYILTYFVREILESKWMGERLGIPPFVMIMVIYVGLLVYGILGFILGPISYVIIKTAIEDIKNRVENKAAD